MDGLVAPLAENLLVACCDAIEPWLLDWIKERGFEIVDVSYAEARNLGVNLMMLGDDKVVAMTGSPQACQKMRALGFEVHEVDMSMFTLGFCAVGTFFEFFELSTPTYADFQRQNLRSNPT